METVAPKHCTIMHRKVSAVKKIKGENVRESGLTAVYETRFFVAPFSISAGRFSPMSRALRSA